VGGILLMILGLGICTGSVALRCFNRGGYSPFHAGNNIVNRHMRGNDSFRGPNFKNRIPQKQNQDPSSVPPSSSNQAPN
jgi:hypothetical protein